ncbi:MAG: hypothetical protein HYT80_10135 [Euryarchaeota archaeon]|nr:hypothetical protein [Euryarchaeota archaeon]
MRFPDLLLVRDFSPEETIIMGIVIGFGVAFFAWLLAGYYERRGGFGKK